MRVIIRDDATRTRAHQLVDTLRIGWEIVAQEYKAKRSIPQNSLLHAICGDVSAQKPWAGRYYDTEDWKRIFLAGKYGQDLVPNPFSHGVVVVNKQRSRDLPSRGEEGFGDFVDEITAWAIQEGVKLSAPDREAA